MERVPAFVQQGLHVVVQADGIGEDERQTAAFQKAFDNYAADCASSPDCPLGTDPAKAVDVYKSLVDPLVEHPAKTKDPRDLAYSDAIVGTILLRAAKAPAGVDVTEPADYWADAGDPRVVTGTEGYSPMHLTTTEAEQEQLPGRQRFRSDWRRAGGARNVGRVGTGCEASCVDHCDQRLEIRVPREFGIEWL